MNKKMSFKLWAVAVLAVGALAVVVAAQVTGTMPKPQKLSPITFRLYPSTSLQDRFARDTERTNAKLAQDLTMWRTDKALMPGYEEQKKTLVGNLEAAYADTYLHHPVLWDENGIAHTGWVEILAYLGTIYPKAHYIHPQTVNVYLEYLPFDKPPSPADLVTRYAETMKRLGMAQLWFDRNDVDFLANVRTVIAYSPNDDPMTMGNELPIPHRKVCDPIY